jgi:hypothetical protein
MAKAMTAPQTRAQLRKWKVPFKEYPGWDSRGRPGGLTDVYGILEHHTGGGSASPSYLKFLFVTGRPEEGIPGPLCNVATAPDGVLHLGAIGRANHAGSGSQSTMDHVKAEDYSGLSVEIKPGPDGVNGNPHYYGNEIIFTGAAAMTDAAYQTALRHAASICDFYGWSALSVIGHREHTRRKDDPGKTPMNKFRTDLAMVLRTGPNVTFVGKTPKAPANSTPTPPTEDPPMAISDADAQKIADAVWAKILGLPGDQSSAANHMVQTRLSAIKWGSGGVLTGTLNRIDTNTNPG